MSVNAFPAVFRPAVHQIAHPIHRELNCLFQRATVDSFRFLAVQLMDCDVDAFYRHGSPHYLTNVTL